MTIFERIKNYLRSPSGRRVGERAGSMSREPRTRERLRHFMDQLRGQRTRH